MKSAFFAVVLAAIPVISYAGWIPANAEGCLADILFPGPSERTTWSGTCDNGKIDGVGTLSSSNGTLLEGLFRQGVPIDVKGRVLVIRDDGRRVAIGATYSGGKGDFYHWKKPEDQVARYSARVAMHIKQYVLFAEEVDGNPTAVVEVKTQPNGQFASFRLVRSSGVVSWDQAVLRATARAGALPFDEDGTIPAVFEFNFRPK